MTTRTFTPPETRVLQEALRQAGMPWIPRACGTFCCLYHDHRCACAMTDAQRQTCDTWTSPAAARGLPLPAGEGRGEGERPFAPVQDDLAPDDAFADYSDPRSLRGPDLLWLTLFGAGALVIVAALVTLVWWLAH